MNTDFQYFKYKELTEKIYENAMMIEFRREGIPAVTQSPIKATDIEVGLLLNFGTKPELKRKAFDNSRK